VATRSFRPNKYVPTSSRSGDNSLSILRGQNMLVKGRGENTIAEVYPGSLNLSETIPSGVLTGTISFSPASNIVTGTGTAFIDELHLCQMVVTLAGEILHVKELIDQTHFEAFQIPLLTGAGVAGYRMPVLYELNRKRGTSLTGNVFETDRGNFLGVGSGVFRINGDAINSSLTLSERAKIAIYDPDTGNYLIQQLGFDSVPAGIVISAAAAAAAKTYTNTDVNTGTNTVTITAHGWFTGQPVTLSVTGGDTLASPLVSTSTYWFIKTGTDTGQFAALLQDAASGDEIDLLTAGSGTTTVTPVTKAMVAGAYGIRVAKASTKLGVPSYGNPGENMIVTLTAGQRIKIDFPAMDSNTDPLDPHDAWRIYGTFATESTGVWYWAKTISSEDLGTTASATYYLEYLDGELSAVAQLISFDNDAPCDAEYVASVTGYPVLVSCQGRGTVDRKTGTNPGPSVVPFKVNNLAAAPLVRDDGSRSEVPTSPPETIIGFFLAAGRLYLLTANSLPIAVFTETSAFPVATRPFWKTGFSNPYALCFVNGTLYGITGAGLTRSADEGSPGSEEQDFAADVEEIVSPLPTERGMVAYDPSNGCACFCYGGVSKNEDGFWESLIVPLMLRSDGSESFSMPILISSSSRDMIISGVATIGNHLEFLAGGRNGSGGIDAETFRFAGGLNEGDEIAHYLAFQLTDGGDERRPKTVRSISVRGIGQNMTVGVHGAYFDEEIDMSAIEAGASGSKSGSISIPNSDGVRIRASADVVVPGLAEYTIGVYGVYDGTQVDGEGAPILSRIDEITWEESIIGARR
jgi:hypothetical protein